MKTYEIWIEGARMQERIMNELRVIVTQTVTSDNPFGIHGY